MREKLEDKAIEVMDKALDGVEKLSNMLSEMAVHYGPDVVDAALTVVRISGAGKIGLSLLFLTFVIVFFCTLQKLWKWAGKVAGACDGTSYTLPVLGSIAATVGLVVISIKLLNPWPWVAIIEPKLWIAHEILKW